MSISQELHNMVQYHDMQQQVIGHKQLSSNFLEML